MRPHRSSERYTPTSRSRPLIYCFEFPLFLAQSFHAPVPSAPRSGCHETANRTSLCTTHYSTLAPSLLFTQPSAWWQVPELERNGNKMCVQMTPQRLLSLPSLQAMHISLVVTCAPFSLMQVLAGITQCLFHGCCATVFIIGQSLSVYDRRFLFATVCVCRKRAAAPDTTVSVHGRFPSARRCEA